MDSKVNLKLVNQYKIYNKLIFIRKMDFKLQKPKKNYPKLIKIGELIKVEADLILILKFNFVPCNTLKF